MSATISKLKATRQVKREPKRGVATLKKSFSTSFGERLAALIDRRGLNAAQAARIADVSKSMFGKYLSGKSQPTARALANICRELRADPAELLGVEGAFVSVDLFKAEAAGGSGMIVSTEEQPKEVKFRRDFIEDERKNAATLGALKVRGSSMAEHIRNGDMVLFDRSEATRVPSAMSDERGTFVLRIQPDPGDDAELVVKHVHKREDGSFYAWGESGDFKKTWLPGDERFKIVGRVFWRGGKV